LTPNSAVAAELARWLPELSRAMRRSPPSADTLQFLEQEVLANRATLWAADRSCAVTQLVLTQAGERHLHFWLCAGDLREVRATMPLIERWGAQQGCTVATLNGRPGWARVLSNRGYRQAGAVLRKEL
jgi:hypothetical protein